MFELIFDRALVGARDAEGKSIFQGRAFTGFSDIEEEIAGATLDVPFSLEARVKYLGGKYEVAAEPWGVSLFFLSVLPFETDDHLAQDRCRWKTHYRSEPSLRKGCG